MLIRFFRDPACCRDFTYEAWRRLFLDAKNSKLLARVAWVLRENTLEEYVPAEGRWMLYSAWLWFQRSQRQLFWELDRIHHAVIPGETLPDAAYADAPVILLKGAAYAAAGLPWSEGRTSVDVDVLVSRENLEEMERRLFYRGWLTSVKSTYDEHFYRQWMHEIPPLYHLDRKTTLDVHHNILPITGRIKVDAALLWEASVPLMDAVNPAARHFRVLSPPDMVLHSAAHLFQDGELDNAFRDVVDLDAMLRYYLSEAGFMDRLFARAEQLKMQRPLFYALRYAHRMLGTPLPRETLRASRKMGGFFFTTAAMDFMVPRAMMPEQGDGLNPGVRLSRGVLYVRSHFLRMPLGMLIPHLRQKSKMRKEERKKEKDAFK